MSVRRRLADGYPLDDPVLAVCIAELNKQGRNAFMEYQLPRTIINLKQSAGRLTRDATDRGVLMFCTVPDLQALRQAHLADSACVPPHV